MSRNGSGTYSLPAGNPVVTGTTISSSAFNATMTDIATALTASLAKDGQTTPTANLPMGGYKLTGLGAGSAAGNSVRWEQASAGVLTTIGDTPYASAANTVARMPATANVAAHATTSNIWGAREIVLTGAVVTFTDIADAPYAGAVAWVKMNDAHIWTDGAVFDVQGGANYTAAANDWIRIYATTVSTFEVTIFKANGTAVGLIAATQADQETGSSTTTYVSPGRQQFHPSAAKAWVRFNVSGGTPSIVASQNVASITDNGVGDYSINYTTAFSSTNYATSISRVGSGSGAQAQVIVANDQTASALRVVAGYVDANGAFTSEDVTTAYMAGFGDQA